MKVIELVELAQRQPNICLTLPRKTIPKGDRVRLLGRSGPYGKFCTVNKTEDGYQVVAVFKSSEVLGFIKKHQ